MEAHSSEGSSATPAEPIHKYITTVLEGVGYTVGFMATSWGCCDVFAPPSLHDDAIVYRRTVAGSFLCLPFVRLSRSPSLILKSRGVEGHKDQVVPI